MSEIVAAFLLLDGKPRTTCIGCSKLLVERGFLAERTDLGEELPLDKGGGRVAVYEMRPGVTLAACRRSVRHRHIGPAWGGEA